MSIPTIDEAFGHIPDKELVDALIQQESSGNHKAVSNKGARGLGQVMPKTGIDPGFGVKPLQNDTPEENRRFTSDYLGALLKKYNGSKIHALAAYNAGPGAVDDHKGVPPFPETVDYVTKILHSLNPVKSAQASEEPYKPTVEEAFGKIDEPQSVSDAFPDSMNGTSGSWEPEHNALGLASVGKAAGNFVPNLVTEVMPGMAGAVAHPIDTLQGGLNLANSAMQKVLPDGLVNLMHRINPETKNNADLINQAGDALVKKYGSLDAVKNTFENRPASMLMDISTVLGGAGALTKSAKVAELGNALNPLTMAGSAVEKGVGYLAPKAGKLAAFAVGDLGTHTGGDSILEAAKAGFKGGTKQKTLIENMRGDVPMSDAIEAAKTNLNELRRIKNDAYKADIAATTNDNSVLSLSGVKNTISDSLADITFNGVPKNQRAYDALKQIQKEVNIWDRKPANFKTPEGLDALKQRIGALKESLPNDARTANMVAGDAYSAIKSEIVKQSPIYAKTMKDYWEASDEISQMEKTLSLGNKATSDTSLRKLQSILRNNANTNYGNRLDMLKRLEEKGGNDVITSLAGQSLTAKAPRGIAGALTLGSGAGGYLLGGPLGALGALAVQSPRLMGETALKVGQAARGAKKLSKYAKKGNKGNLSAYLYELGNNNAKR